jgi:hypothetical protein
MQDAINGPLPAVGKSDVEGYFDGPYYEWYRYNEVRIVTCHGSFIFHCEVGQVNNFLFY